MFCPWALFILAAGIAAAGSLRRDAFELYVYGASGVGGYPLININNTMYFSSRPTNTLGSDAHVVQFQIQGGWSLRATSNGGPSYYVKLPSPSGMVTYTNEMDDSVPRTSFGLSGRNLYARRGKAKNMRFYAEPTGHPDLYAVGWNLTDNGSPLAVRNTPPVGPVS